MTPTCPKCASLAVHRIASTDPDVIRGASERLKGSHTGAWMAPGRTGVSDESFLCDHCGNVFSGDSGLPP